jgi:hypothetical protein
MLSKDALISEFGGLSGQRTCKIQRRSLSCEAFARSNLGGRNLHKKRAKRESRARFVPRHVKLNGRRSGTAWLIFPAIYDDERAEFARFVVSRTRFGRGQKDCGEKHGKTGNGGGQLFQRLSGRMTSAAPAKARIMRNAIQD